MQVGDILTNVKNRNASKIKILGISDDEFSEVVWFRYLDSGASSSILKPWVLANYRKVPEPTLTEDELRIISQTISTLQDIYDSALSGSRGRSHCAQDLCDDARVIHDLGVQILA